MKTIWVFMAIAVSLYAQAVPAKVVCTNVLTTSWGRAVTADTAWREYPRPQLVRAEWTCLNGNWDYAVTSVTGDEPRVWDGKILVPYPIESLLSGVRRRVTPNDQIWYRRTFTLNPQRGFRTILNFERVDFRASVFVNGVEAMDVPHEGGNVPFSCDITEFVRAGENELKVLVWDPTDMHLGGTGKQALEHWTCFYGASSGICGSVWMETVPETYLADYHVTTDAVRGQVTVIPDVKGCIRSADVEIAVSFGGQKLIAKKAPADTPITLDLPRPLRCWSCAEPNLYDLEIVVSDRGRHDRVNGYFGLRTVETKLDARGIRRVAVNGRFTYLLATLDQGWWPDGLLTPPSEDACRFDVDFHKKAGFNTIRKHIKIEPRAFYAHCDRIGVMVLQDIPSLGSDRFLKEILPHANKRYAFYRQELKDCVDHLRNHPSIVMWIPFNEGWGQPSADKTRFTNKWLRCHDPSRLIDGPSGWNDYEGGMVQPYTDWIYADVADGEVYTDCVDLHHYPDARMHPANSRRVSILGEFGGMGVALEGHVMDPEGNAYSLRPVSDPAWRREQEERYADFMKPLPQLIRQGLGGSVYVEAIDQYWEIGGFVTFDRAIVKFDYAFLRKIHQGILDAAREAAETPPPPSAGPSIDWEASPVLDRGEWPRLRILADGRFALTYSKNRFSDVQGTDAVVRYSSDRGRSWGPAQTMIPQFVRPDGAGGRVAYHVFNPELVQLPPTHPVHPGRLVASANLRPEKNGPNSPSSIGVAVSDDNGKTWSAVKTLLPVAGDAAVKGGRSCWEPFVQTLPDGTLHLYYSDIAPIGPKRSLERHVACFTSCDGGDTWSGPVVTLARFGAWVGMPSSLVYGDRIYLAHEARPDGQFRPFISMTSLSTPWREPPRTFDPFATPLGKTVYCGAPYLVQTKNYFVLSGQSADTAQRKNPFACAQMRVWVMPKKAMGAAGELNAFAPVADPMANMLPPMGYLVPTLWNSLTPLDDDEVMAVCQRGADIHLVHGRIR